MPHRCNTYVKAQSTPAFLVQGLCMLLLTEVVVSIAKATFRPPSYTSRCFECLARIRRVANYGLWSYDCPAKRFHEHFIYPMNRGSSSQAAPIQFIHHSFGSRAVRVCWDTRDAGILSVALGTLDAVELMCREPPASRKNADGFSLVQEASCLVPGPV